MNWSQRSTLLAGFFLFALPSSTNYQLHDMGLGSGGVGVGNSSSYSISGISGEVSGNELTSTAYDLGPGLTFARQSNVPGAPTFGNPDNYYNRLQFILENTSNPSDTLYVIAISSDDFATTSYIQSDGTVGATAVYQTYADWGGASGEFVTGLSSNTTYKIKVKAVQTKYTETEFSSTSTAATTNPSLSYDIDIASSDSESGPPYTIAVGQLSPGSVTTATNKIWVDLDTNSESGAFVYIYSSGTGLTSTNASYTLTSATANLASVDEGYGLRVESVTQSSGGPLAAVSPYNGASDNVGIVSTTSRNILTSSGNRISSGRSAILVKAKASGLTPASSDYTDTITLIASATF